MLKRLFCLLAVMLMLIPAALAEGAPLAENPSTEAGAFPVLNEAGFLDVGEYVYINEEAGVWRYVDDRLKVEIYRCTGKNAQDKNLTWYEAEAWSRDGETWQLFTNNEGKHMSGNAWPWIVAQKNQVVLAINTDYAQYRYPKKNNSVGIVIRNGKVFSAKTRATTNKAWPSLDVLALYPDGRMEVYESNEKTADEYLEMGVTSTLCFGPWLIRDGVLNTEEFATMNLGNNPRTAIGMVEPGHTVAMMLEGRHKGSVGGYLNFLAERMLEKGCTLAFNLDGGETSCILFMGEQINVVGGASNKDGSARRTTELLGIGVSELVPKYEE